MPIPKEQKIAFEREFKKAIKRAEHLPDKTIREMLDLLRNYRNEVVATVASSPWEKYYLDQLRSQVDIATARLVAAMRETVENRLTVAWEMGGNLVLGPAAASGLFTGINLTGISIEDLAITKDIAASLVTDLSNMSREKIMQTIQMGMLGNKTQQTVIQEIGQVIISDTARKKAAKSVFKSVADRASFIYRTEVGRALNAGHFAQAEVMDEQYPGEVRKYWMSDYGAGRDHRETHRNLDMATNPARGGKPIPVKQKFNVGVELANQPHSPELSAGETVNCLCRLGETMLNDEELQEFWGKSIKKKAGDGQTT